MVKMVLEISFWGTKDRKYYNGGQKVQVLRDQTLLEECAIEDAKGCRLIDDFPDKCDPLQNHDEKWMRIGYIAMCKLPKYDDESDHFTLKIAKDAHEVRKLFGLVDEKKASIKLKVSDYYVKKIVPKEEFSGKIEDKKVVFFRIPLKNKDSKPTKEQLKALWCGILSASIRGDKKWRYLSLSGPKADNIIFEDNETKPITKYNDFPLFCNKMMIYGYDEWEPNSDTLFLNKKETLKEVITEVGCMKPNGMVLLNTMFWNKCPKVRNVKTVAEDLHPVEREVIHA